MGKKMYFHTCLLLSFLLLLLSCSNDPSVNTKTQGIWATFSVVSEDGTNVTARAVFQSGGATGTYLKLTGGDSITVNGITMSEKDFLGAITYTKNITYQAGGTYTFELTRQGEGVYTSTITLPYGFEITSPEQDHHYSLGSAITVNWSSGGGTNDKLALTLRKTFLPPGEENSTSEDVHLSSSVNAGSAQFNADQTTVTENVSSINAQLTVTRAIQGTIDSSFKGGEATGKQERSLSFIFN